MRIAGNYRVAECFHFSWPVSFPSPILPAEMKTEASTFDCRAHRVIVLETVSVRNGFGRMSNLTTDYFFHHAALSEPGDIKPSGRVWCRARDNDAAAVNVAQRHGRGDASVCETLAVSLVAKTPRTCGPENRLHLKPKARVDGQELEQPV